MQRKIASARPRLMRSSWMLSLFVLVVSCWQAGLAHASVETLGRGCSDRVVRDYEAPLRGLPADRVPARGSLPFAPDRVSLQGWGDRTVLQSSGIGYWLMATGRTVSDGSLASPVRLDWEVQMRLWRIDRRGRPQRLAAEKRWWVRSIGYPQGVNLSLRSRPGIYRFDMAISKRDGRVLNSYRRYVRILPERVKLRIATSRRTVSGGELLVGRLENLGTYPALLVSWPILGVERFDGEGWVLAEPEGDWTSESTLQAGVSGHCKHVFIPSDATEGAYRFKAVVQAGGRKLTLTKAFQ